MPFVCLCPSTRSSGLLERASVNPMNDGWPAESRPTPLGPYAPNPPSRPPNGLLSARPQTSI